jgi:hypothetical protein
MPAPSAGGDLHGAARDVQPRRDDLEQPIVGRPVERRRAHPDQKSVLASSGDFGLSSAGNDADVQLDARWRDADRGVYSFAAGN